jgi:hypothetical protein
MATMLGIAEEVAAEIIDSFGFAISKTDDGRFIGTKETAEGSGLNAPAEPERWENTYDKQYNTVKKINAELRKREKLERQY